MSDAPPQLPATEDPFELLGVTPPVDERELKRAYVRLIKRYRPERAPAEFQRIHAAYEEALARAKWPMYAEPEAGDDRAVEQPEGDGPKPASADATRETWQRFEGAGELREGLLELVAGFERGLPLAEEAFERLEIHPLGLLACHPAMSWSVLRNQANRWAAIELLSLRLDELVMRGMIDAALTEITASEFRHDVLGTPELDNLARAVMIAAAWDAGPALDEMFRDFSDHGDEQVGYGYLFGEIRRLVPAWRRALEIASVPPALVRFIKLFPAVGHHHKQLLVSDVASELPVNRQAYLNALDAIQIVDPALIEHVHAVADGLVYGEDVAFGDLPAAEQSYIERAMTRVEKRFVPPRRKRRWPRVVGGAWAAAAGGLLVGGLYGLMLGTFIVTVTGIWIGIDHLGHVMTASRRSLADAIVETGLGPHRLYEWWHRDEAAPRRLLALDDSVVRDMALHVLARLARVSILWSRK